MMRIFKIRLFQQWAEKIDLSDEELYCAAYEMGLGKFEANLGGYLYKKRIAVNSGGKSGGLRVIVAYKKADKFFFIYGFAKNKRANINKSELAIYKDWAKTLLSLDDKQLQHALKNRALTEVKHDG